MERYKKSIGYRTLSHILNIDSNIKRIENQIHKIASKSVNYDKTYKIILYDVYGDFLNKKHIKQILQDLKNRKVLWEHSSYSEYKLKLDEHDEFIENPFEVEEGVAECKCGSKRVFTYQQQRRSADEPMTTIAKCVKCNKSWTYSG